MEINVCYGCMRKKEAPGPCPHCGFDESTYEPAPHHLQPGTVLYGKYLIGRVLGEGGFGITYVGWDLNLEMKVAVKEYYPNGFVTRNTGFNQTVTVLTGQRTEFFQKGMEKFVDEARRLGKFWRLPGIVAVKDYFQENKTAYIVMEFVEGQTLKSVLKNCPQSRLPAAEVFEMMRPVMKSLETVHQAGLIHRDISPDNLMIDEKGQIKLIDFGAARDFMADGERSLSVMLKPGYAPEEQYRSRGKQGPWTDVYGLCATIYRAITGKVPDESLDRLSEDHLLPPSKLGISVDARQEDALMQGLEVFQDTRFQTMNALEQALFCWKQNLQDEPPSVSPQVQERRIPEPEAAPAPQSGPTAVKTATAPQSGLTADKASSEPQGGPTDGKAAAASAAASKAQPQKPGTGAGTPPADSVAAVTAGTAKPPWTVYLFLLLGLVPQVLYFIALPFDRDPGNMLVFCLLTAAAIAMEVLFVMGITRHGKSIRLWGILFAVFFVFILIVFEANEYFTLARQYTYDVSSLRPEQVAPYMMGILRTALWLFCLGMGLKLWLKNKDRTDARLWLCASGALSGGELCIKIGNLFGQTIDPLDLYNQFMQTEFTFKMGFNPISLLLIALWMTSLSWLFFEICRMDVSLQPNRDR